MFGFIRRMFGSSYVTREAIQGGQMATLRRMLDDERFAWRSIGALAHAINATAGETRLLLATIGARRSRGLKEVYTTRA